MCVSLGLTLVALGSAPAFAQSVCDARVDGQPTNLYGDPSHSLELDVDTLHRVQAVAPDDATSVRVEVETPIGKRSVIDAPVVPGSVYDNPALALDKRSRRTASASTASRDSRGVATRRSGCA